MDENLTVFVNRRKKLTTKQELEKCSKEVGHAHQLDIDFVLKFGQNFIDLFVFLSQELIDRILQLESHNQQLKNVLKKEMNIADGSTSNNNQKKFDFTK